MQKCRYLFSQLPSPSSNSEKDFLSFVSPFFSWYYFSILFSLSLPPKPQSHADWVADQFKQRGFSAAKRRLAGVLWSLQYFVCGHTIKDLGVAIGRMWKSDPGSPHPTNSLCSFLALFLSLHHVPPVLSCLCNPSSLSSFCSLSLYLCSIPFCLTLPPSTSHPPVSRPFPLIVFPLLISLYFLSCFSMSFSFFP